MRLYDVFSQDDKQLVTESLNVQQLAVAEGNRPFRGVGGAFKRGDNERHDLDPTDWYIVKDGEMFVASIYPKHVQQAISQGFSRTQAEAQAQADSQGVAEGSLGELANTSLKVKEPKNFVNTNDRKQVIYKVMKFKSGKDTYLINFIVKGAPAFGKKQNWNAVNVSFGVREDQDDYSFGDEINTDLTAKNKNQFLIYSTVINAVRKFITEYNTEIDEIIMQGAGERQEAIYQRFFQSAGKYFPGWHHDGKHSLVRDVPRQTGKKVKEQGVAEGATDDPRFQKMMGNIQKSTPALVSGYVALNFASEQRSKKIKGVSQNGKPIPDVINNPEEFLGGKIEFTPDQVEQQLMAIGKKYGWDSIDSGQGQGYTEMFFDTNKEYTSNNQNLLAANIANTVSAIKKFFNGMNSSLQATGLPGYKTDVWQGMGPPNDTNQIGDLSQIVNIAKGKSEKSDPGPAIGKMILKYIPSYEAENDELGYDPQAFTVAKAIANTYITQGERAGLEAQHSEIAVELAVSDMIDELLSDAGGSGLRTIWNLNEQGMAEGDKKPYPRTWHNVDPNLGKQVDTMSQAEKVKKGLAHPNTLKKSKQQGVAEELDQAFLDRMNPMNKKYHTNNPHMTGPNDTVSVNQSGARATRVMPMTAPALVTKKPSTTVARATPSFNKWMSKYKENVEEMQQMIAEGEQMVAEMKQRLDPRCWTNKHKEGTKIKGGVRVNNCVPNESVAEESSPMIKPPANRFDNKQQAFDYAKEHGGKVFKSTYIDPNTGIKNITFVVKKEPGVVEASNTMQRYGQLILKRARAAREYNLDAAQREMDRRAAEGEDMTGATIDKDTYEIVKPKLNSISTRDLMQQLKKPKNKNVAEATGDERFDSMMGQIQREPPIPDPQMPPTDVKDLYQWAVKNNKPYHKIFAKWANREGYKSVAPALQKAGNLDTDALDYWTPKVWKIYWGEVHGIDSEMPDHWRKERVPDELRDYLETVFDAYENIWQDWPTEYRQIGQQGVAEATGDERFDTMMGQITGGAGARQGVDNLNKSLTARTGSDPETALAKFGQEFIKWLEDLCREFAKQGADRFSKLEKLSEFEDGGETMAYWLIEVAKQTKTSGITLADIQEFSSEFNTHGMWAWQMFPIAWSQNEWQDYKDQWTGPDGYIANLGQGVAEGKSDAIDTVAKRLTDPKDGMTAKLRAAGDKRREDKLKGRNISRRDTTSKDEWGDLKQAVAESHDSEDLANEVYAEFEKTYPNLARRADERTIHAAIMDVLNYGGDNNPGALAQDVARAVKQDMQQGVAEDWNKVNHQDKTDGLSQKAVNAYRRENPGSKLKTAVTTKPSKLKAGSKAANRRKSFCARMGGNKGPMKTPSGKPTPKALALRRWHCESVEEMQQLIILGEQTIAELKSEKRCMQCGMKNCKCPGNSCKCKPIAGWEPGKGFKKAIEEAKTSAAVRLGRAIQRTQGRTAASQARSVIPSSIPKKEEPKKDEKKVDEGIQAGDGFIIECGDSAIETVVLGSYNDGILIEFDHTATFMLTDAGITLTEAEYQGRTVPLGKRMAGDVKKSKVYVKKPNGNVVKVNFGDKNMTIKKHLPKHRKSYRARHHCENPGPKWKANYWSCRAW